MMGAVKAISLFLLALLGAPLTAQSCPKENPPDKLPPSSTLNGTIHVYHQLRTWIGIDLSTPACGEKTIQLTFLRKNQYSKAESLDGCTARVTGPVDFSPTGYYSANLFIQDPAIAPAPNCHPKSISSTPSVVVPPGLRSYKVEITVDIPNNLPMSGHAWRTDGRETDLTPWDKYADITLTGGYVIWADCRKDFTAKAASSSTHDEASLYDGRAGLDPSEDHTSKFLVSCVRQ
jgi:hypothetical protein